MNIRGQGVRVRGKLVGRVGVEPTTKRLRESLPNSTFPQKQAHSPLIEVLKSTSKPSAFRSALRGGRTKLTDQQVHEIRTAGLTDSTWGRRLRLDDNTIRNARQGRTYKHVATPPDLRPREGTGSTRAIRNGQPQPIRAKQQRRSWL